MIDSRATNFTPFSMRGPVAAGPTMQGMRVAPPGYQAPQPRNIPNPGVYPSAMAAGMHRYGNPLQVGMGAPTMARAGAQPVQGMQALGGQPPTGMNPQYQQALISSLRNSGQ